MSMRNLLASASLATLVLTGAGSAMAAQIPLGGYSGPIQIKFDNYESFTGTGGIAVSNSNYGIVIVTNIVNAANPAQNLWSSGVNNAGFIYGVFSGIHIDTVIPGASVTAISDSPAVLSLFWSPTTDTLAAAGGAAQGTGGYAAAGGGCTINQNCYNGITNVGLDNILNLTFSPDGISPVDPNATVVATGNLLTNPVTGTGQGFLRVTSGTDTGTGGQFPLNELMFFQDNFCQQGNLACNGGVTIGNWFAQSHDPVTAVVVPEPSTLAVFGSSLLGLVLFGRWRRKRAA